MSTLPSRLLKELRPCRSFLPPPLSPKSTAATSKPPMAWTWDDTSDRYGLLERRLRHWVSKRVKPTVSGCQARRPHLLPVLNIWRRSRKALKRELHALNGNTSAAMKGHCGRNVRARTDGVHAACAPTWIWLRHLGRLLEVRLARITAVLRIT